MSTYCKYECFHIKSTTFAIIGTENSANFVFVKSRIGDINFRAHHLLSDIFFSDRLMFLGPMGQNLTIHDNERLSDPSATIRRDQPTHEEWI